MTSPDEARPDASRIELPELQGQLEHAQKTEAAWRLLMESVKDFAIVLLDRDGRFASWNEGAERLLGYGASEMLGQPFERVFVPEDVRRGLPPRELENARVHGRSTDDNWLLRKDGSRFWASGMTTPLHEPGGRFVGFAKVVRDLSERKRYEEEIERLNVELEKKVVERTLQLEAFTYTVSHDLRAPLRAMNGYATLLLQDYGKSLDERGRDYALRIETAAGRMDALIQDLLEYSRLSGSSFAAQEVDLDALVSKLLEEMSDFLTRAGADVDAARPLGRVRGHGVTLKQVLYNLLANAVKFVPRDVPARVRVRSERRDDRLRLWVEDDGIGIAPEHHARIFGIFERLLPAAYPGTGIGLAIVRLGVERMGGRVGVDSELGRGSRFWIELPEAAPPG